MHYEATKRKSRTQWAADLKSSEYKTFTHPTGCKRGHEKVFSVSEGGKCVECVRLKDQKRYAKKLGLTVEELEQQRQENQRLQEERKAQIIAERVAANEARRLAKVARQEAKERAQQEAKELKAAETAERQWWATKGWRLIRQIHKDEKKQQPRYAHIYAITNTINGKTYIGSSSNIKSRLANHRAGIKYGNHHVAEIIADAEKHGSDAFQIEIISTLLPDNKAERLAIERHYIETWDGELYNKHYRTDNYDGNAALRELYRAQSVASQG